MKHINLIKEEEAQGKVKETYEAVSSKLGMVPDIRKGLANSPTAMNEIRKDHELPLVTSKWGWKYHHMGIPTKEKRPGERYIPHLKMYVSGFESSPYGIEWMRFEEGCPLDTLIQTVPHVAFEVDDLDEALNNNNFELISSTNSPSDGVRVAMIKHNGAPVELIQFEK